MPKQRKLAVVAILAAALVSWPQPASARPLPSPLKRFFDVIAGHLGLNIANHINGYINIALGGLDKLIGVDPGSISGALGIVDPLRAAQAIDQKQLNSITADLGITNTAAASIDAGRLSAGISQAIGSSILSTQGQSAMQGFGEATSGVAQQSADLAQQAQGLNVTQDIAKIQTQQNAQQIALLNAVSQQQSLLLQQQAAGNLSLAVTAEQLTTEAAQTAQAAVNEAVYTTSQSGVANGVIGGVGQ